MVGDSIWEDGSGNKKQRSGWRLDKYALTRPNDRLTFHCMLLTFKTLCFQPFTIYFQPFALCFQSHTFSLFLSFFLFFFKFFEPSSPGNNLRRGVTTIVDGSIMAVSNRFSNMSSQPTRADTSGSETNSCVTPICIVRVGLGRVLPPKETWFGRSWWE